MVILLYILIIVERQLQLSRRYKPLDSIIKTATVPRYEVRSTTDPDGDIVHVRCSLCHYTAGKSFVCLSFYLLISSDRVINLTIMNAVVIINMINKIKFEYVIFLIRFILFIIKQSEVFQWKLHVCHYRALFCVLSHRDRLLF